MNPARVIPIAPAATRGAPRLAVLPALSLYVHVPWCVRKCPYCDFNSHALRGALPESQYIDALIADLESALPAIWGRRVGTVFIGGGTPSLLSAAALERLLGAVRARLPLSPEAEITLEANPGTAEAQRFSDFRAAGVTRLSIGVQSFDDRQLAALGRIHDAAEAHRAIELAQRCFERVNIDLMYALPGQSPQHAAADVAQAIAHGVGHLSAYHLTVEPHTAFAHAPPALPSDDLAADIELAVHDTLAAAGFERYEVSAFAAPGERCRHNLNYWTFGDYLGIGAGAHSKLSSPAAIWREARARHPDAYIADVAAARPAAQRHDIADEDLPAEFAMNALRLADGVPAELFALRTGLPLQVLETGIARAVARGLLAPDPTRLACTALGWRMLNSTIECFLQ